MALLAGLSPKEPFGIIHAELYPFLTISRDSDGPVTPWNSPARRLDLMNCRRIRRDVFLKALYEKGMDEFRLFVRHLLPCKPGVELERVAARAMVRKPHWGHCGGNERELCDARVIRGRGLSQLTRIRKVILDSGQTMAVLASHLNSLAVRADELRLHVQVVIEAHLAGVGHVLRCRREFRVSAIETGDRHGKVWLTVAGMKGCMALGATGRRRDRQTGRPLMFDVTG